jgi:hypothetical protein
MQRAKMSKQTGVDLDLEAMGMFGGEIASSKDRHDPLNDIRYELCMSLLLFWSPFPTT